MSVPPATAPGAAISGPNALTVRGATCPDSTVGGIHASVDASSPHSVVRGSNTPAGIAPGELEAEIVAAASLLHRSRHRLITALVAFDRSGTWALTGAHTCAHWAAGRLGVHVGTAREWLRVGHALARLPLVDEAMQQGRLSYCAVRTLTRIAVEHPDHEAELVEITEHSIPAQLSRALAAWALGRDTDEQRERCEREGTYMSTRVEPDGMGSVHIRLPAIDAARMQAAVDARVMQSRRRDPDFPNPSLGHQRANALLELLGCRDNPPPRAQAATAKVETEVIVHVRANGCSMHDGTPIAENTVASLIDDSFIRMLIHDAENRPVNASTRRRHPTTRQRRVVDERDPCCVDCGSHELLEYDHDPEHSITARTHTDELFRRCPRCHTRRHQQQRR